MSKTDSSVGQMAEIREICRDLTQWLVEDALPAWQAGGIDSRNGGFFETIDPDTGTPGPSDRRSRVQPRQIYSFAEGVRLGWDGPAEQIARLGLTWFEAHYLTKDGFAVAVADNDGRVTAPAIELYNQAFALFGYAHAAETIPGERTANLDKANALMDRLEARFRHPVRGFREFDPKELPLNSNPHMHLFEAFQTLEATTGAPRWAALADEIATLALERFIDPATGALREFFNDDWAPMPDDRGRVVEPGHQFEWAWLLTKWGVSRHAAHAIGAARRLYHIGRTFGVDPERGVAIMALNDDFTMRDPLARLWGQTEWLKAAVALAGASTGVEKAYFLSEIPVAAEALHRYLKDVPAGLWRDKLEPDGTFVNEPAPASSFYHIVCAISELAAFVGPQARQSGHDDESR